MINNSDKDIAGLFYALYSALGQEAKTDQVRIYVSVLAPHLQHVDLKKILHKLVTTHKFFPKIPEILELVDPGADLEGKIGALINRVLTYNRKNHGVDYKGLEPCIFHFAKRIGMDLFSISSGNQEPSMCRKIWIQEAVRVLKEEPKQYADVLGILNKRVTPELTGQTFNE